MGLKDKFREYGRRFRDAVVAAQRDGEMTPQKLEAHNLIDDAYRRGVLRDRFGPDHALSPVTNMISGPIFGGPAKRKLSAIMDGRYVPAAVHDADEAAQKAVGPIGRAMVPASQYGSPIASAAGQAWSGRAFELSKALNEKVTGKPLGDRKAFAAPAAPAPATDPDNPGTEVPTPPEAIKELERQLAEQREKLRKGGS